MTSKILSEIYPIVIPFDILSNKERQNKSFFLKSCFILLQDANFLEKEATPKLEVEKEAGLDLEVEKLKWEVKQNLEVEKGASPKLEAELNPQDCKSLPRIKGCEDKSTGEGRLKKVI